MSRIDAASLKRWATTSPTLRPSSTSDSAEKPSRFPVDYELNFKIALWYVWGYVIENVRGGGGSNAGVAAVSQHGGFDVARCGRHRQPHE